MASENKKRRCIFSDVLQKNYPFLKQGHDFTTLNCVKCNGQFSISSGGKTAIQRHLETEKHLKALKSAASSRNMNEYFRYSEFGSQEKQLAISEAVYCYHVIFHNQSFRSMDCTSKLIQKLFEKKFSCARTKAEAIVKKVLAPHAIEELRKDLEAASFLAVFSDASNHKDIKLFPTLIRYFDPEFGVKVKILDFVSLPGETSELISESILEILKKKTIFAKN